MYYSHIKHLCIIGPLWYVIFDMELKQCRIFVSALKKMSMKSVQRDVQKKSVFYKQSSRAGQNIHNYTNSGESDTHQHANPGGENSTKTMDTFQFVPSENSFLFDFQSMDLQENTSSQPAHSMIKTRDSTVTTESSTESTNMSEPVVNLSIDSATSMNYFKMEKSDNTFKFNFETCEEI